MPEIIEIVFHSKYLSDFQLSRLVQASLAGNVQYLILCAKGRYFRLGK